jgi:hypothetical protein
MIIDRHDRADQPDAMKHQRSARREEQRITEAVHADRRSGFPTISPRRTLDPDERQT